MAVHKAGRDLEDVLGVFTWGKFLGGLTGGWCLCSPHEIDHPSVPYPEDVQRETHTPHPDQGTNRGLVDKEHPAVRREPVPTAEPPYFLRLGPRHLDRHRHPIPDPHLSSAPGLSQDGEEAEEDPDGAPVDDHRR